MDSNGAHPRTRGLQPWHAAIVWMAFMAPLATWGLPSRANDDLLFGGDPAWPAERYQAAKALAERRERVAGADTDLNPLATLDAPLLLTAGESQRAEILRRYRLYTHQPDEMITLQALQRMNPREGDFDPRLYQYGGAFIYLVGGGIAACAALGLTELTSSVDVYLLRPELFAVFYLVGRAISLLMAAGSLLALSRIAGRLAGPRAAWLALLLAAAAPVFITESLEAKPHGPSTCMTLWSIERALAFVAARRSRDLSLSGACAGLASGFVLTGVVAILAPVAASWMASAPWRRKAWFTLAAGGLAIMTYAATNPYVLLNAISNPAALESNLGNSTAMYSAERVFAGAARVGALLVEGGGLLTALLGLAVFGWTLARRRFAAFAWVIALPALALLVICSVIGAGKPAEFGRFLLTPACGLALGAALAVDSLVRRSAPLAIVGLCAALLTTRAPAYLASFSLDAAGERESRRLAGEFLREQMAPADSLAVVQEPAPYSVPPVDFTRREVWLLPREAPRESPGKLPRWLVCTADDEQAIAGAWWREHYRLVARFPRQTWLTSRISWANKATFVLICGSSP